MGDFESVLRKVALIEGWPHEILTWNVFYLSRMMKNTAVNETDYRAFKRFQSERGVFISVQPYSV